MKKSELLELLNNIDGDPEIVMSSDGEGNDYSPLSDIDDSYVYLAENTWSGKIYDSFLLEAYDYFCSENDFSDYEDLDHFMGEFEDYLESGYDIDIGEFKKLKTAPKCVVLYPVN